MKRILFYLIVLIFGVIIVNLSRGIFDLLRVEERVETAEEEVLVLQQEHESLKDELAWRSTEAFVEQEIRNKLKMAKPDEVVVMVEEDMYLEEQDQEGQSLEQEVKPNWQRWWELFY